MITIHPALVHAHRLALRGALADYERRAKVRETRQQTLKGLTDEEEALRDLTRTALDDLEAQMDPPRVVPPGAEWIDGRGGFAIAPRPCGGGEEHRLGGPSVEGKVRGPQLKPGEELIEVEDEP